MPKRIYPASPFTYLNYPFLQNKYYGHYSKLMQTRKTLNRKHIRGESKTHQHHMLPKSLGGHNRKDNIVVLTYKEHFIAHALLVKITTGSDCHNMVLGFAGMCHSLARNGESQIELERYKGSRLYISNMEAFSAACKTRKVRKGWHHSPESNEKNRQAKLGKSQSPEHIEKRRRVQIGKKMPPGTREKIRRALLGEKHTPEHNEKVSRSKMGVPWSAKRRAAQDAKSSNTK